MPESKNRPQHHPHPHPLPPKARPKKNNKAVITGIIFFALLGVGIGYFIGGDGLVALGSGGIVGAIAGYFFGHQIDKALKTK